MSPYFPPREKHLPPAIRLLCPERLPVSVWKSTCLPHGFCCFLLPAPSQLRRGARTYYVPGNHAAEQFLTPIRYHHRNVNATEMVLCDLTKLEKKGRVPARMPWDHGAARFSAQTRRLPSAVAALTRKARLSCRSGVRLSDSPTNGRLRRGRNAGDRSRGIFRSLPPYRAGRIRSGSPKHR